ncbi:uroporphyrinogen-III synthase [Demequina sp.]|uniref:uroporphyrinogen-III synthase n=1 Tax=Demequina sp. TaxID=2050685 RepID=UPI0025C5D1F5|nr:uroporphyrinogen-III synthase [Demequina sp.]
MTDSLQGIRVVVPVTKGRLDLADTLRGLGATVMEGEFIVIQPTADPLALRAAVGRWCDGEYEWMAITSRNALGALHAAAETSGRTLTAPMPPASLAVVGEATARASADIGLEVALRPSRQQSAGGLVAEFPEGRGRVLVPVGNLAGDTLERGLARKGWSVDAVEAYRTVDGPGLDADAVAAVGSGAVDAVVLTSGSVAKRFAAQCATVAQNVAMIAMGQTTASAARAEGLDVALVAATPDYESVIAAVRRAVEGDRA